jgi:chromosome partitioning protein
MESVNRKFISVTGFKGGVAKTTTAIHLAAFLSFNNNTLLIDADPNRTAIKWSKRGNLPFQVASERESLKLIAAAEYIIIDTPARPNSEDLKEIAANCNLLILPSAPDALGIEALVETASAFGAGVNYKALLTIVPPLPSRQGEIMLKQLKDNKIPVFETVINRSASFQHAALLGATVGEIKTPLAAAAAASYVKFGKEVLKVLGE